MESWGLISSHTNAVEEHNVCLSAKLEDFSNSSLGSHTQGKFVLIRNHDHNNRNVSMISSRPVVRILTS